MKLAWSPDDEAFRAELVEFLDANTPPEAAGGYDFFGETSDGVDIIPQWLRDVAGHAVRQRLDDPRATRPSSAGGTAHRCRR